MTSFLLTEVALDLLGNKFYSVDGKHIRDLQTLYKLNSNESDSGEQSLASVLGLNEDSLNGNDYADENVIVLDDDDEGDTLSNDDHSDSNYPVDNCIMKLNTELPAIDDDDDDDDDDDNDGGNDDDDVEEADDNAMEEDDALLTPSTEQFNKLTNKTDESLLHPSTSTKYHDSDQPAINQRNKLKKNSGHYFFKNDHDFNSKDVNERLSFIIQTSGEEYARMKKQSTALKKNFLDSNRALINLRALKEEDFLKKFYIQQKISLIEESNALMQFIKSVKNEDSHSKDVLIRVASDILKAKDLIA